MNTGRLAQTGELKLVPGCAARPESTADLISQHYIEIDYLLQRVELSTNHYQALSIERSATNEQIVAAYHQSVHVLHPAYYKVRAAMFDDMFVRIDQVFERLSDAFTVLTNPTKRAKYDRSLRWHQYQTNPIGSKKQNGGSRAGQGPLILPGDSNSQMEPGEQPLIAKATSMPKTTRAAINADANTRRSERIKLTVPALITGYDNSHDRWQEIAKSIDVSRLGVAVRLKRKVSHGAVVHVTLPLPTRLRSHGFGEAGYSMYAIVRRVEPFKEGGRVIGLEFLGPHPPKGYLHKPWSTFRTEKWSGIDRRREPRYERVEQVGIEYLDEAMRTVSAEMALTENVSLSGVRICVKAAPAEFEMVRIKSTARSFESLAMVRNRYSAADGVERICLQFIQRKWPVDA